MLKVAKSVGDLTVSDFGSDGQNLDSFYVDDLQVTVREGKLRLGVNEAFLFEIKVLASSDEISEHEVECFFQIPKEYLISAKQKTQISDTDDMDPLVFCFFFKSDKN